MNGSRRAKIVVSLIWTLSVCTFLAIVNMHAHQGIRFCGFDSRYYSLAYGWPLVGYSADWCEPQIGQKLSPPFDRPTKITSNTHPWKMLANGLYVIIVVFSSARAVHRIGTLVRRRRLNLGDILGFVSAFAACAALRWYDGLLSDEYFGAIVAPQDADYYPLCFLPLQLAIPVYILLSLAVFGVIDIAVAHRFPCRGQPSF